MGRREPLVRKQVPSSPELAFREQLAADPHNYHSANKLAVLLARESRFDEAIHLFEKVCKYQPENPNQYMNLARALMLANRMAEAEVAARRALLVDPTHSSGANLFLAGLGSEPAPERISDALLQQIYGARAARWDDKITSSGFPYRTADLVAQALLSIRLVRQMDILDAGCGTGLVGGLVRDQARRLDGVDLSAAMLNKAREKAIYDSLTHGDLLGVLLDSPHGYDVVLSAATLIHFGELAPVFAATASVLRNNGLFIFSVFPNDTNSDDFAIHEAMGMALGGCYCHGKAYLYRLARESGFEVLDLRREIQEHDEAGQPVFCVIVVLRNLT